MSKNKQEQQQSKSDQHDNMQHFYRDIYQEKYKKYNYNHSQSAYQREKDQKEFSVKENKYDEHYRNEYDNQSI